MTTAILGGPWRKFLDDETLVSAACKGFLESGQQEDAIAALDEIAAKTPMSLELEGIADAFSEIYVGDTLGLALPLKFTSSVVSPVASFLSFCVSARMNPRELLSELETELGGQGVFACVEDGSYAFCWKNAKTAPEDDDYIDTRRLVFQAKRDLILVMRLMVTALIVGAVDISREREAALASRMSSLALMSSQGSTASSGDMESRLLSGMSFLTGVLEKMNATVAALASDVKVLTADVKKLKAVDSGRMDGAFTTPRISALTLPHQSPGRSSPTRFVSSSSLPQSPAPVIRTVSQEALGARLKDAVLNIEGKPVSFAVSLNAGLCSQTALISAGVASANAGWNEVRDVLPEQQLISFNNSDRPQILASMMFKEHRDSLKASVMMTSRLGLTIYQALGPDNASLVHVIRRFYVWRPAPKGTGPESADIEKFSDGVPYELGGILSFLDHEIGQIPETQAQLHVDPDICETMLSALTECKRLFCHIACQLRSPSSSFRRMLPWAMFYDNVILVCLFWNQWSGMFGDTTSKWRFCDPTRLCLNLEVNCQQLVESYNPSAPTWVLEQTGRSLLGMTCMSCKRPESVSMELCDNAACREKMQTIRTSALKMASSSRSGHGGGLTSQAGGGRPG